jgi:hypothetical protein
MRSPPVPLQPLRHFTGCFCQGTNDEDSYRACRHTFPSLVEGGGGFHIENYPSNPVTASVSFSNALYASSARRPWKSETDPAQIPESIANMKLVRPPFASPSSAAPKTHRPSLSRPAITLTAAYPYHSQEKEGERPHRPPSPPVSGVSSRYLSAVPLPASALNLLLWKICVNSQYYGFLVRLICGLYG